MNIIVPLSNIICFQTFQKLPDAEFHIVADAGHSFSEPGVPSLLVEVSDKYKNLWFSWFKQNDYF